MKIQNLPQIYTTRKPVKQVNNPALEQHSQTSSPSHVSKVRFNRPYLGFKGEKFIIYTGANSLRIFPKIKTEFGEEPVLFWGVGNDDKKIPSYIAKKLGLDKNYSAPWADNQGLLSSEKGASIGNFDDVHYAIYYKDTGKWDNNYDKGYLVNAKSIFDKAICCDKKEVNHSLINVLSKGTAQGKLIVENSLENAIKAANANKTKPLIAMVDCDENNARLVFTAPSNIKAIIFNKQNINTLGHAASNLRSTGKIAAVVFDDKKIKDLKKYQGKNIELKAITNRLEIKEIDEITAKEIKQKKVVIPKVQIKGNDKPLLSSEYEPHLVGQKAYNLKRLEEAKIPDIIIPKSFAVPPGFYQAVLNDPRNSQAKTDIEKQKDALKKDTEGIKKPILLYKLRDIINSEPFKDDIDAEKLNFYPEHKKQIKNCLNEQFKGLNDKKLIVRSAFNGEDVKGYSAAGLYDSDVSDFDIDEVSLKISQVWESKWNDGAYNSRTEHQIPHDDVQPTVIVQKYIPADYTFTIYTKDPRKEGRESKDNIFIVMQNKEAIDPYIITYDKKDGAISVDSKMRFGRKLALDENLNILEKESGKNPDPINEDKKLWMPLLKKVGKAAMRIEKEFGGVKNIDGIKKEFAVPQDIEGGIVLGKNDDEDPKIYVWQTRDLEL